MKAFRLRALAARVLLLVMVPSVAPSASQGLPSAPGGQALGEKRIRGFNYIASWSGNAVGQWRFYDPAQAELELGYLASIGANSIRVWLSYAVWEAEGAAFLGKLADFLDKAEARDLSVMAVLWDAVGAHPSPAPYDDLVGWTASPGPLKVADPAFLPLGDAYAAAVVTVAAATHAEVIWDIMNEPDNQPAAWVEHYLALVQELAPSQPATVSYYFAQSALATAELVDLVSFHPYGIFRANVEAPAATAAAIAGLQKPILATELGFPGGGQRYEDVLQFAGDLGVGFYLFQAMIGDHPYFPWKGGTGFFFKDGTIRDLEAVRAFQSLAKSQGFALGAFPLVAEPSSPLWAPYTPMPPDFGVPEATALLTDWAAHYGVDYPLVQDALDFYTTMLEWTFASFWLAGVLSDEEMDLPAQLLAALQAAALEGDWLSAEVALGAAAELAGVLIAQHDLGEPPNRPPEILQATAAPNPELAAGAVLLQAIAWDPEGTKDIALARAEIYRDGHAVFAVPLPHQGSGFYALTGMPPVPLDPSASYAIRFVVTDQSGAEDELWTLYEMDASAPAPGWDSSEL